ncbi:MAG TPA: ethanolamine utilization protein EutJ [bacterium]|nr:ethanolamine utilization protein EutJ [bacterium]HOL47613.1 ethanolamine utilization protein EutJ [bacterium]HPQ19413.1 ethanolamine utilization protein EutJ [bacterium]
MLNSEKINEINRILEKTYQIGNQKKNNSEFKELKVGLDLGTALIKFLILNENNEVVLYFYEWANVIRDGIVCDYWGAVQITKRMINEAMQILELKNFPKISAGYPPKTEPRLVENVIYSAGYDIARTIEEPVAAAKFLEIENGVVVDIGGGTTGIAIIRNKKIIETYDEPTGGHHITLVISGNQKIPYEEAEIKKRNDKEGKYFSIIKPVIEKMASIVKEKIKRYRNIKQIYLVGGPTAYKNFREVFENELQKEVFSFKNPELITPYGITI